MDFKYLDLFYELYMSERDLLWKRVEGNPLWLRGMMSRYKNPSGFAMAMAPERNARINDPIFAEVLAWIKETNFPAKYTTEGMIAFETEEDMTMFLLRWSGTGS